MLLAARGNSYHFHLSGTGNVQGWQCGSFGLKGGTARGSFPFRDLLILHSWTLRRTTQVLEWDWRTGAPSICDARRDHPANNPHQLRSCVKSVRNCPDHATLVYDAGRQASYTLPPIKRRRFWSYITLFSLFISLTLCSSHPTTTTTPSLQHDGQSIARQSAPWCCSHLRQAKKEKRKS